MIALEICTDRAIADRVLLHALCIVSDGFRAETTSGGSKGSVAAVPVRSAANGLYATITTADGSATAPDAATTPDAASERGLSPGTLPLAASNDIEDTAKSSSASYRTASNAVNGPASASAARRPVLASSTALRLDEVKILILLVTTSLKDGVSLFFLISPFLGFGVLNARRIARHRAGFPTIFRNSY
jgi:hypothetical protein